MAEHEGLAFHHRRATEKQRSDADAAGRHRGLTGHYRAVIAMLTEDEARALDGLRLDRFMPRASGSKAAPDAPDQS